MKKGLTQNAKQALKEFKLSEKLRPIKIVTYFPPGQPEPTKILENLSNSYFIPIITPKSVLTAQELERFHSDNKSLDEMTK